jgi:hypothetical protein
VVLLAGGGLSLLKTPKAKKSSSFFGIRSFE